MEKEIQLKKGKLFGKMVLWSKDNKIVRGIVVRAEKKRKHWYYTIVWEDFEETANDWEESLIPSDYIREDKI